MDWWRPRILALVASAVAVVASSATLVLVSQPAIVGCPGSSVTGVINCRAVVTSQGGHVFGVPLGAWALLWVLIFWGLPRVSNGQLTWAWCVIGFLGVSYAIGTEWHVGHLCAWCTLVQLSIVCLAVWRLRALSARTTR